MSSIQVQLFNSSIKKLVRSLVIKDVSMAQRVNLPLVSYYSNLGIDPNTLPLDQHKYYLNLAGRYHTTDVPMYVVSLDTMETIEFTSESLDEHRGTRREYRARGRYYEDLVATYPGQESLIQGILNPVDIQVAIDAPNYTILQYDTSQVEPQETNLIYLLQEYVYNYMSRWVVKDYAKVDSFYPAAQMAVLYIMLPNFISAIRLGNCKTYSAHSFHIWNYLESNGKLGEYKDYLHTSQALWLYMNITWVNANVGKQETFERLVDVVLSRRGIPLAKYETALDLSDMGTNLKPHPIMRRTPLNLLDTVGDDTIVKSVDYVMSKHLPLAKDNAESYTENLLGTYEDLSSDLMSKHATNVYESEMVDIAERLPVTLSEVLIENWMYLSTEGLYGTLLNVQNPYTGDTMSMSVKDAFIVWFYTSSKLLGYEIVDIPDLKAVHVPRMQRPTRAQLRAVTPRKYIADTHIDFMVKNTPRPLRVINTSDFYDYCTETHKAMLLQRKYYATAEHRDTRGWLKSTYGLLYPEVLCQLTPRPTKYKDYFEDMQWDLTELGMNDLTILTEELFSKATGSNLNVTTSLYDIQKALLSLMARLTEYTSDYVQTINTAPSNAVELSQCRIGDTGALVTRNMRQNLGIHLQGLAKHRVRDVEYELRKVLSIGEGRQDKVSVGTLDPTVKVSICKLNRTYVRYNLTGTYIR